MAGDNTFDKFKKSVNRGITTISVKTQSTMEKSKSMMHIDNLEREINKAYSTIGETAYTLWESGSNDWSVLTEKFENIKELKGKIASIKEEIDTMENKNKEILGKMAEEAEVTAAPENTTTAGGLVCPNCGQQYDTPVKFCRKCGQNLSQNQS